MMMKTLLSSTAEIIKDSLGMRKLMRLIGKVKEECLQVCSSSDYVEILNFTVNFYSWSQRYLLCVR